MVLGIYLLVVNLAAFIAFGADKHAAVSGRWRTRESTLLGLCLIGGAAGGLAAMHLFHHKTRKSVFAVGIPLMIVAQVLILLVFTNLLLR